MSKQILTLLGSSVTYIMVVGRKSGVSVWSEQNVRAEKLSDVAADAFRGCTASEATFSSARYNT